MIDNTHAATRFKYSNCSFSESASNSSYVRFNLETEIIYSAASSAFPSLIKFLTTLCCIWSNRSLSASSVVLNFSISRFPPFGLILSAKSVKYVIIAFPAVTSPATVPICLVSTCCTSEKICSISSFVVECLLIIF